MDACSSDEESQLCVIKITGEAQQGEWFAHARAVRMPTAAAPQGGGRALEQQVAESGAMNVSGLGLLALPIEAADTVPAAAGVHVATALPAAATRPEKGLMTVCTQQPKRKGW